MHPAAYLGLGIFIGIGLGYAFRGRENYMIRLTVNEAIAEWTKAKQMAQGAAQGVMKKL